MKRVLAASLALALVVAAPAAAGGSDTRTPGPRAGPAPAAPLPAPPGRTTLLSKARKGGFPNGGSLQPSMSTNGRFVAFTSNATNLTATAGGGTGVFLLDRKTGKITRVSPVMRTPTAPVGAVATVTPAAAYEPSISGDGQIVAYTIQPAIDPNLDRPTPEPYVVAWNRATGRTQVVSRGPKGNRATGAHEPSTSADGRYIAYTSSFDWPGENDEGMDDVFRFDRKTGATQIVSDRGLGLGPSVVGRPPARISGSANSPSISGDGNLVAFASDGGDSVVPEDTGNGMQVYVRDVARQTNERISRPPDGRSTNNPSTDPAISGDGRYVAFSSGATNLTPEAAAGLFRYDRQARATILVSVTPSGAAAKGAGVQPSITPDGRMIAWTSNATDLVPETAGRIAPAATIIRGASDVYIRDIDAGETLLVSVSLDNTGSGAMSLQPSIGGGGRFIAFASTSPNLVRGDDDKNVDVFLRDLPPVPVIRPATLDLGARAVGTESLPLAATLGNAGWTPLTVTGASITGSNKADFRVVADACAGRRLARNEACSVSVEFKPTAKGSRAATLAIADDYDGSPRTVRLRGRASQGKVVLEPAIGQPGIVTIAQGSGFPPRTPVRISWTVGITPKLPTIVTDAKGTFRAQVLVFHNDFTGRRELLVEALDGTAFPSVSASMLVTKPSVVPPRFDLIRIVDLPLMLVFRG